MVTIAKTRIHEMGLRWWQSRAEIIVLFILFTKAGNAQQGIWRMARLGARPNLSVYGAW
jgi:hypothetical protein